MTLLIDRDLADADWTKWVWDLPPRNGDELDAYLAERGITVEQFIDLPAFYLAARYEPWLQEWAYDKGWTAAAFVEAEHPRDPRGTPTGGRFTKKMLQEAPEAEEEEPTVEAVDPTEKLIDETDAIIKHLEAVDAPPEIMEAATTTQAGIRDALAEIDAVHGVLPGFDTVPVWMQPIETAEGSITTGTHYSGLGDDGLMHSAMIMMDPTYKPEWVSGTMVHETGHYMDLNLGREELGRGDAWFTDSPESEGWRDAVYSSQAATALLGYKTRSEILSASPPPNMPEHIVEEYRSYAEHFDYALSPKEMWARSYAQWVAIRDPDTERGARTLHAIRAGAIEGNTPEKQWEDDDFEPIAAEFDKIFGKYRR